MTRATLAWLALVVPMWLLFVLGTHWEPIMRDGWYHWLRHRDDAVSLGYLADFAADTYLHNNPRIGQLLTLLLYAPGPWHEIVTPLVELALFYLLTALVIGRWPSWRRTDDALVMATTTAIIFLTARSFGPMLFYRPYTGNYLYGFVLNLLWLVPYRFHAEEARRRSLIWAPVMFVLGVIAGLANEHTGPAFIAAGVVALIVYWRRGERFVPWAVLGLIGAIVGLLALIYAPGQELRYNGLATQQTLLERIAERGTGANVRIVSVFVTYLKPALFWVALGIIGKLRKKGDGQPRSRRVAELALVAMALLVVVTLLASPKQGERLYFAAVCVASAAIAGWVVAQLGRIERAVAAGLAVVVIGYVGVRLISVYHTADKEFSARMAALEHGAPGSVVTVPPYSQKRSRYFLGDDFQSTTSRGIVATELGLAGIELSQRDETTPPADDDPDAP
jgi:hypothetical protein